MERYDDDNDEGWRAEAAYLKRWRSHYDCRDPQHPGCEDCRPPSEPEDDDE